MKLQELHNEEMYCFVAADGAIQLPSIAASFEMSLAFMELLASSGISRPVAQLFEDGWEILPIKITATQNGTADEGFKRAKARLK